MSVNTWPGGHRHAMDQSEHARWNAHNWPGTRQICCRCLCETDRCEEDEITSESGEGPFCVDCWHQTDEYRMQTDDYRMQTDDYRMQTDDYRMQTDKYQMEVKDERLFGTRLHQKDTM